MRIRVNGTETKILGKILDMRNNNNSEKKETPSSEWSAFVEIDKNFDFRYSLVRAIGMAHGVTVQRHKIKMN